MSEMQPDAIDRAWDRHLHPRCSTCGSDDPKVQFSPCLETYPQDTDTFHQSDTESEDTHDDA